MAVKLDDYDGVCVISVNGDLAGDTVAPTRQAVEAAIDGRQIGSFVVDLEKTTFVDSEGLEALLWLKRRCEDRGGQAKLAAADEHVRKILEVTRLDRRFEFAIDVPAALKTMR